MSAFSTYLAGGTLPPITAAACAAWPINQATEDFGPTVTSTGLAGILDAIHSLETAIIALQG